MNDVSLNQKKIHRLLPPARGYVPDRIPTIDENRDLVDAADAIGKTPKVIPLFSPVLLSSQ